MTTTSVSTAAGDDNDDSPINLLKDSQTLHSLQNPPQRLLPNHKNDDDFFSNPSDLTPQEIANHLFLNSEILAPM
eukprot:scaffold22211_cov89-Skeletonema_dohrnii-CCMP3373.AAC.1